METTSRGGAVAPSDERDRPRQEPKPIENYLLARFPWYGLDEAFLGPRWLTQVGLSAEGSVEHGSLGHGDEPKLRATLPMAEPEPEAQRFAVVVTLADRPVRRSPDGTGTLEATSVSSAAWLAGSGLLSSTWPSRMDRALRQDWLDQQTAIAWELADDLEGDAWSALTLPVDGTPTPFRYRESEYGWVLAGSVGGRPRGGVRTRYERLRPRPGRGQGHQGLRGLSGPRSAPREAPSVRTCCAG